ncbi:UTRA domain-containing protein [Priestia megaterium]|uniref:UTRA domain-containing protein n=1 Tax=Priestia megaterium TaxID=1404 RepID=UPI00203C2ECA|nr:UTRA domain-containing protein [Priestia megaterium]MCM3186865.1 UTRA domain-containing protein [Priestia megaterium]
MSQLIFNYNEDHLGLKIGFTNTFLRINKLTNEEANYLGLQKGDPRLYVELVYHLTNGQPFNFSKVTYNYTQSQFSIQTYSYCL